MTLPVPLQIHLTGRVRIEAPDAVLAGRSFPGRQVRLAFAYLVTNRDRPIPRDELADVLWANELPAAWERNLPVILSRLRTVLTQVCLGSRELITNAFGCYELHLPPDTWVDIEAAPAALEEAEAAQERGDLVTAVREARLAADLARLPLLPGDEGPWLERARAHRRLLRLSALDMATEAALAGGDRTGAVLSAREAVEADPFREHGHRQLMQALVAAGDRAGAARTFNRCRQLLGMGPSPETEALYAQLLATHVDAAPLADNGGNGTREGAS